MCPNSPLPSRLTGPRKFGRPNKAQARAQYGEEHIADLPHRAEDLAGLLPRDQLPRPRKRLTPAEREEDMMRSLPREYDHDALVGLQYTAAEARQQERRAGRHRDEDEALRGINTDPETLAGLGEPEPRRSRSRLDDFQPFPRPRMSALDKTHSLAAQEHAALRGLRAGLDNHDIIELILDAGAYSAADARRLLRHVRLRNASY
jgi:hypothetical protein